MVQRSSLLVSFLFVGVGALFSLVTASPFRVTFLGPVGIILPHDLHSLPYSELCMYVRLQEYSACTPLANV